MRTWRLIVDDGAEAAAGLALDEALMHGVRRAVERPRPTLRLYTYAGAALVGRFQTAAAELNLAGCAHAGLGISRRLTGGGAIVMGPDQLGVALVVPAPATAPRALLNELGAGIVDGLGRFGVRAAFGGKNDLLVNGRKIAGLGLYRDEHGALLFHASVLVDLDVAGMLAVLRIPAAKLGGAGADAVRARITTVRGELGRPVALDTVRDAVAAGLARCHGVRLAAGVPDEQENAAAAELIQTRYADDCWVHAADAIPAGTGSAVFRSSAGLCRVHVAARGNLATSVLFTGDFTVLPEGLRQVEAALRWRRLDPGTVGDALAAVRRRTPADLGWDEDRTLLDAVLTAAGRALDRGAAPVRPRGSCYCPDLAPVSTGGSS